MMDTVIHIVPDENFDDWVVRDENGHEFGHYPTREAAELAAEPIARSRHSDVIVHLPDGRMRRKSVVNGRLSRLFRR